VLTGALGAFERAATATSRSGPRGADAGADAVYESSRAMGTMARAGQFDARDQAKLMSDSSVRKQRNVEGGEKPCDQFVRAWPGLARETLECVVNVLWANSLASKLPNGAKAEGPQPANQRVDAGKLSNYSVQRNVSCVWTTQQTST
jgi:hypothetical protein